MIKNHFGTIERGTSIDSVLEVVRNSIIAGELSPGSQLKQNIIADELGVSQGPVREALVRLTEEGLVESIPYRGMFVKILTAKDVEEIYQIRCALEVLACTLAFQKLRQPEIVQMLEGLVEATSNAAEEYHIEAAVDADLNFHRTLVKISGNSRLLKTWDSLLAQARSVLRKLYTMDNGANIRSLAANHKIILEAIKKGDLAQVSARIEEHFETARETLFNHKDEVMESI
jgi:DNA-binding GntR family transcriptional regulator